MCCLSVPLGAARAEGTIRNVNTLEDFRNMDKPAMLKRAANTVGLWDTYTYVGSLTDQPRYGTR